jgi:hypothetical protein
VVGPPVYKPNNALVPLQARLAVSPAVHPMNRTLPNAGTAQLPSARSVAPPAYRPVSARPIPANHLSPPRVLIGWQIQQTPEESETMKLLGREWCSIAEKAKDHEDKIRFFEKTTEELGPFGFKCYTVWHKHDPYIGGGSNKNYVKIVRSLRGGDQGQAKAQEYVNWATGTTKFEDVSDDLQELIVIVHVAEVGRGYLNAPEKTLAFMSTVCEAGNTGERKKLWDNFKNYLPFALTAKEDTDYDPMEEEFLL